MDGKRSHASTMNRFLFIFLFSSPTCMKLIGLVVDGKKRKLLARCCHSS